MVPKLFSNFNKNKKHFLYDGQKTSFCDVFTLCKRFLFMSSFSTMVSIEEIALEFLDFLQNRAIKVKLLTENDELLTRA